MKLPVKFWWKCYFFIAIAFGGAAIWAAIAYSEPPHVAESADVASWVLSLVGVFGFAFSRPILVPLLWKIWVAVAFIWDIGRIVYDYAIEPEIPEAWLVVSVVLLVGLLIIPQYIALYLYGFRSDDLWKGGDSTLSGE